MGLEEARGHSPQRRTYLIRIKGGNPVTNASFGQLKESKLYVPHEYIFDDLDNPNYDDEEEEGCGEDYILFKPQIAKRILLDFRRESGGCKELLVHCFNGEGRSPAVGLGLNNLFDLGEDSELFSARYPKLNKLVYSIMLRTGYELRKELGLKTKTIKALETLL